MAVEQNINVSLTTKMIATDLVGKALVLHRSTVIAATTTVSPYIFIVQHLLHFTSIYPTQHTSNKIAFSREIIICGSNYHQFSITPVLYEKLLLFAGSMARPSPRPAERPYHQSQAGRSSTNYSRPHDPPSRHNDALSCDITSFSSEGHIREGVDRAPTFG